MDKRGVFITFEGTEGCGKTTQVKLLKELLLKRGLTVKNIREPGSTFIGDQIRSVLLRPESKEMNSMTELMLYEACRAQLVADVIKKGLNNREVIICDRYTDSTLAYQGFARGHDLELIRKLNNIASMGVLPDLTILLDIDLEKGLVRARNRNNQTVEAGKEDRFERESLEFHTKVRNGFLEMAKAEPSRFRIVNADGDIPVVHSKIASVIDSSNLFTSFK